MNPSTEKEGTQGDAFVALGFTLTADLNPDSKLEKEICACGHAITKHEIYEDGAVYCFPAKMMCPCAKPEPTVEVQDVRHFLYRTKGFGKQHALGLGLKSLSKSGKWSRLLIPKVCRLCVQDVETLLPIALNLVGRISRKPERLNGLICNECLEKLLGLR